MPRMSENFATAKTEDKNPLPTQSAALPDRPLLASEPGEQAKAGSSSSREKQLTGSRKSVPGAGVRQCQRSLRMDFGESNVGT